MPDKRTHKSTIQYIGLGLFVLSLLVFTAMLALERYRLTEEDLIATMAPEPGAEGAGTPEAGTTVSAGSSGGASEGSTEEEAPTEDPLARLIYDVQAPAFRRAAVALDLTGQTFGSSFSFQDKVEEVFQAARSSVDESVDGLIAAGELPEGISEWDVRLSEPVYYSDKFAALTATAEIGPVVDNPWLFLGLTIGLGVLGGILYILPKFGPHPGIKHDHIYHSQVTKGLNLGWRGFFLAATILGILLYGIRYMAGDWFWPAVTVGIALLILALVLWYEGSWRNSPARPADPAGLSAYIGILAGTYLIGFYVLLYWTPAHVTPWITMVEPLKTALFGGTASQWFLYGLLYTLVILVMGVRMITKYRHNKYQLLRTGSVMFFQLAFAFLIPEILGALNKPQQDLKNIWPLDYDFFFGWQLEQFQSAGAVGIFMLVWGVVLIIVGVPLMVHLVGKRWYCSWVCGCGGLAETMGDPWRQLSDKSLRAWKFERWIVHGVLLAAILMTALTLYSYFTGAGSLLGFETWKVQKWYGFLIGAGFAGVVGTGFYPLMGNRVWCRFGCPLAAYLGLVQRFQSRFRITTNGGQCISCGNCSTYCEMGIDVRAYAQRGQDIVRASCVGCGVCAAVCPRGVLRLENSSVDAGYRTVPERVIHVSEEEGVSLMG
ncbi:4Fe-4S dicluster domain-containing protein [Lewinella sp. IMCC34191]|uniref:4Fe-4S dicluster domain-containing protein n=1 Tax=Lewinella sp. IMCC34191 TaxID=2259172 RepID=UPI001E4DE019|nr:4Fe-4S dicluster domain-containing protein [Lewinella sp. IMCC34191]